MLEMRKGSKVLAGLGSRRAGEGSQRTLDLSYFGRSYWAMLLIPWRQFGPVHRPEGCQPRLKYVWMEV